MSAGHGRAGSHRRRNPRRRPVHWAPAPWSSYALAAGLVTLTVLLQVTPELGGALGADRIAWILVLAGVAAVAARLCGPGPGLAATAAAAAYAAWALVPAYRLTLASGERILALGVLLVVGIVVSLVSAGR